MVSTDDTVGALEVRRSTRVHGFGLFAVQNFVKGDVLYDNTPYKIPRHVMDALFACNTGDGNALILEKIWGGGNDFYISLNIDQYINHSSDPNSCHGRALRDIPAGDEIFENYASFDNEDWFQTLNKEMGVWSYR